MKYEQEESIFEIPWKFYIACGFRNNGKPYGIGGYKGKLKVRPVNGETHFNDVGFSHGFVHFADPKSGEKLGYSGVNWFEQNAEYVLTSIGDPII